MQSNQSKRVLDYVTTRNSVIMMFILFLPFNVIHEVRHLIPCYLSGHQGYLGVTVMFGYAVCGGLDGSSVFRFAGGWLATIVAMAPLTVRAIRIKPYLCVTFVTFALAHLLNALVETFANDWYMASRIEPTIVMNTASFAIFIMILVLFARNKKP